MRRDVGELGEAVLRQWAADTGATANKAYQDRGGWDFIVEIPMPQAESRPLLDQTKPDLQCLVQVKSTDSSRMAVAIKLSNWHRLVSSPLPAFVLLLGFDGRPQPVRAHLVHVWEPVMERVLRRLRELSDSSPPVDLRRRRMSVRPGPGEELDPVGAASFVAGIKNAVGLDVHQYAAKKRGLLDELGYEPQARGTITTRIRIPQDREADWDQLLADLQLGLVEELETEGGAYWDRRFGIESTEPQRTFDTVGRIVAKDIEPKGTGRLELRDGTRRLSVEVDIFAAPLTPGPDIRWPDVKLRLRMPFGDIITSPRLPNATIRWSWPEISAVVPLRELVGISSVLRFLGESGAGVEIWLLGSRVGFLEVDAQAIPSEASELARAVGDAWTAAKIVDGQDHLRTSVAGLLSQRSALGLVGQISGPAPRDLELTLTLAQDHELKEQRFAYPYVLAVRFDDSTILLPTLFEGLGTLIEGPDEVQLVVRVDRCELASPALVNASEEVDETRLLRLASQAVGQAELLEWWESGGGGNS